MVVAAPPRGLADFPWEPGEYTASMAKQARGKRFRQPPVSQAPSRPAAGPTDS